jgi:protein-tyrosine phosphatase
MLESFNLILTMEYGQKEALQVEFPQVAQRVFLLSEMEGKTLQVEDPVGKPLPAYEETVKTIDQMLARGMQRIFSLVEAQDTAETGSESVDERY